MAIDAARVAEWMRSNDLTAETRLYRYTRPGFLKPTAEPGVFEISANPKPSEAVIDVYAQGHITLAEHCGAGLAFAASPDNAWRADDRRCVELRLGDAIEQGGAVYPVESVTIERVWYVTLPRGTVRVRADR
jgi:hypothetical protein